MKGVLSAVRPSPLLLPEGPSSICNLTGFKPGSLGYNVHPVKHVLRRTAQERGKLAQLGNRPAAKIENAAIAPGGRPAHATPGRPAGFLGLESCFFQNIS